MAESLFIGGQNVRRSLLSTLSNHKQNVKYNSIFIQKTIFNVSNILPKVI